MPTLSTPTAQAVFPAGTKDTAWTFAVTGTLADGSGFSSSDDADKPTLVKDLPPGTFTLVVTKNGISSLASDPFSWDGGPVTLSVPDAAQKAVIAA